MFHHLPSLKAIRAFEAAARHGSFAHAADELAVSPGAISYQIKQLEGALGTLLFERKARQILLTHHGEKLFQLVHRQFLELDSVIGQIAPGLTSPTITVSVSTYFVTRWLSRRMRHFFTRHPDITIRLQHSVNDPDFRLENTDLAIKWGDGQWGTCQSTQLIAMPMIAVCSPALTRNKKRLSTISDLRHHTLLRDQESTDYWDEWLRLAGSRDVSAEGPVIIDPNVRVQSAIDGQGVVLANPLINDLIDSGELHEPFNTRLDGYGYYLAYQEHISENPAAQRFINWLQEEALLFTVNN